MHALSALLGWLAHPSYLLVRYALFGVMMFFSYLGIYTLVLLYGADWTARENGPVELSQVTFALMGSGLMFAAGLKCRGGRTGVWICASLLGYAAARECDQLFEHFLFTDAYKWVVGLPLICALGWVLWEHRDQIVSDSILMMKHPAAALFAMAGIYVCTFCQMLDRPLLWHSNDVRTASIFPIKVLIEESAELFAYAILAFAGLESYLYARHRAAVSSNEHTISAGESHRMTTLPFEDQSFSDAA